MKFRMVDRLLVFEPGRRLVCRKSVSFEEYQLPARLGLPERLPASLLLQSAFEGVHWFVALSSGYQEGWLPESVESVEFRGALRPGESVELEVLPVLDDDGFSVVGSVGGVPVLTLQRARGRRTPLAELLDPHDMQTLTAEIAVPEVRAAAGVTVRPA